jgi:predicted lysophospholipase L1 biosynthesis ABC-type transport system permease subunit
MSATLVYRGLIAIRGSWIFAEWICGWGVFSQASLFKLTHPYAALTEDAITVAFWLVMLGGMWFFQRWARLIFVVLVAVALLISPFRVHRYSLSAPPSFVSPVIILMLLVTLAILAMSFLPPVRDCFAKKSPNQALEPTASRSDT